jgi:glycosyltransferase involved in cell wall biosynthesis
MKIFHYAKILPSKTNSKILRVGGSESSVINLAKAQAKTHDVVVLNTEKKNNPNIKNIKLSHLTFNLINIFFNNPFVSLMNFFGKPNMIIIHEIYNFNIIPLIFFSRLNNINIYICPRGTLSPIALEINRFKKYLYHKIVFRNIVKLTDGFIALNKGEKFHIKKLFKSYKIYVIPNGINKTNSYLKRNTKTKFKKKKILVGFLGRYDFYIKGLDILLKEYALYLNKSLRKSIKLIFIGEHRIKHGYSSKLIINHFNKIHKKNSIILSGPFYDKKKYKELLKFDILIQPSRSEGMPNTVLEAMSMGVPVAATKETNILNIIKKSNSGWEINHKLNNISNFLLKLENINKKEIFNYGLRGYKYSIKNLDIQKISDYCFNRNKIRSYKF